MESMESGENGTLSEEAKSTNSAAEVEYLQIKAMCAKLETPDMTLV